MRLGENIKFLRISEDISQLEISEKLNISRQTISKWETGQSQPSLEMLIELANFFEVSIDDLIRGDLSKKNRLSFADKISWSDTIPVDEEDEYAKVILPRIELDAITSYAPFKTAYELELELDRTGNKDLLTSITRLYTEAIDKGIIEAGANMLRILTIAMMNCVVKNPKEKFPLQDKVDYYFNLLDDNEHPAGAFYRAIHLIYRLVKNDKTDEENWDEGLILMYQLANDGNEFAIDYVEYIESAEAEDDEAEE